MFEFNFVNEGWCLAQSTDLQMRDLVVALVSIGLGLNILYAVYSENARCYQLGSVQMLERNFGRTSTRLILCCIGGLCLLMGAYLVGQASTNNRKIIGSSSKGSSVQFDLGAISK